MKKFILAFTLCCINTGIVINPETGEIINPDTDPVAQEILDEAMADDMMEE